MLGAALHQPTTSSSAPGALRGTGLRHTAVSLSHPGQGMVREDAELRPELVPMLNTKEHPGSLRLCPLPSLGPHRLGLCSPQRAARDLPLSPGSAGAGAAVPGPGVAAAPTSALTPPCARSRLCHACASIPELSWGPLLIPAGPQEPPRGPAPLLAQTQRPGARSLSATPACLHHPIPTSLLLRPAADPSRATKEHPGPPKQPAGCSHHPHGGHHSPTQGSGSIPAPRAGGRDPSSHLAALRGRVTGTPAASGRAQRSRCRRGIWGSPTRLAQQQSEELLPPHGCRELPQNPTGRVSIPQQANVSGASALAAPPPASPAPRRGDGADSNSWYLPPQGCGFTTFPPI